MRIEEAFGQTLRKLRIEAEYSQEFLAQESGLDRTYISMLERGVRQPSLKSIFAIAKALKISSAKMIDETEKKLNR